jgi:hypothetical protein
MRPTVPLSSSRAGSPDATERWSHNLHYDRVILDAIPRAASGPLTSAAGMSYRHHLYWRYPLVWARSAAR